MTGPKKTLVLSDNFPPRTGGSGRYLWEIYSRIAGDGLVIAAGEDPRQEGFDRRHALRVVRLPLTLPAWGVRSLAALKGYWRMLRLVRPLLRAEQIEQIHAARLLPEGWAAWLLKKWLGLPYICYTYGEELNYGLVSRELGWMMRRVLNGADFITTISRNTERILRDDWGVAPERIHLLYPGVDSARFVPAARDPAARARLGWGDRPVVLTVGRLQKRKGHDMMIKALHRVRQAVPDVLYAIVGDGEERQPLEQLARGEGLAGHVQFQGEIGYDDLLTCYQQCDLFTLPNREVGKDIEGFGIVLLEAQACGKPVIAGTSGGTAETMRIPETGFAIPCDEPTQLGELAAELLPDPQRRARMGEAGRQWVVEQFDWAALGRQAARLLGRETPAPAEAVPS